MTLVSGFPRDLQLIKGESDEACRPPGPSESSTVEFAFSPARTRLSQRRLGVNYGLTTSRQAVADFAFKRLSGNAIFSSERTTQMRIPRTLRCALQAVTAIAESDGRSSIPCSALARTSRISVKFLSGILGKLVTHGVLVSRRGAAGGYRLARPPDELSVLMIVEAICGPLGVRSELTNDANIHPIASRSRGGVAGEVGGPFVSAGSSRRQDPAPTDSIRFASNGSRCVAILVSAMNHLFAAITVADLVDNRKAAMRPTVAQHEDQTIATRLDFLHVSPKTRRKPAEKPTVAREESSRGRRTASR